MAQPAFKPGLVLAGKYRLGERLGEGGMGSVYHAEHLALQAPVAIKVIDHVSVDENVLARFSREAQAAAALRSPHVVQILDYGTDGDLPFMVMELLEGETLARRIKRRQRLSAQETAWVLAHVGRAVGRAHELGIVHRDLKPDNVFLVHDGEEEIAKVLDFGIAKFDSTSLGPGSNAGKTRTGSLLGTPYYMSPEQAQGNKAIDHRSDLWALGVIAFECITGQRPFTSDGLGDLVLQICIRDIPVPSAVAPVPIGFDAWFARATQREPADRFQSARELTDALKEALGVDLADSPSAPAILVSAAAESSSDDATTNPHVRRGVDDAPAAAVAAAPGGSGAAFRSDPIAPTLTDPASFQASRLEVDHGKGALAGSSLHSVSIHLDDTSVEAPRDELGVTSITQRSARASGSNAPPPVRVKRASGRRLVWAVAVGALSLGALGGVAALGGGPAFVVGAIEDPVEPAPRRAVGSPTPAVRSTQQEVERKPARPKAQLSGAKVAAEASAPLNPDETSPDGADALLDESLAAELRSDPLDPDGAVVAAPSGSASSAASAPTAPSAAPPAGAPTAPPATSAAPPRPPAALPPPSPTLPRELTPQAPSTQDSSTEAATAPALPGAADHGAADHAVPHLDAWEPAVPLHKEALPGAGAWAGPLELP